MTYVANVSFAYVKNPLLPRPINAHKGMFGHVVVIGGDFGMPGAVRIAAEGALRVGAGLVTVLTRKEHVTSVVCGRPELLCYGVNEDFPYEDILNKATVIVLGPGLGMSDWSHLLFKKVIDLPIPKIIDADGLNILAKSKHKHKLDNCILTPHPGEAGRLLGISTKDVQNSRIASLKDLQNQFAATIVLKGYETLVGKNDNIVKCLDGNPAMATGGMGDLLSGIIAGFVAQKIEPFEAAQYGVLLHGKAGDLAQAKRKGVSVLASDLLIEL